MTRRSQQRKQEIHGYTPPPVTGITPDTATIAAVGAVGRLVATLTATGGTAPFVYAVVNAGTLAVVIAGNALNTAADPVGPVGTQPVSVRVTDIKGKTITENVAVTVT
jgi:3-keto-L-gulonate-6-phosphate decarboxylase